MDKIEKVESPLSIFNNIILEIGNKFSEIYNYDVYGTNNCIFDNESVILFGFLKFTQNNGDLILQVKNKVDKNKLDYLSKTINNWKEISAIVFKYFFMLNNIQNNLDKSISINYINSIIADINKPNLHDKIYLIPYKNKIYHNLDKDKTLLNIFGKFSYVLNMTKNTKGYIKYSIIRVLSSDLNESNSIENIRPLEKEFIYEGTVSKQNIGKFLKNLMFYGEIEF